MTDAAGAQSPFTVLLVEADPARRKLMKAAAEAVGARVLVDAEQKAALQRLRGGLPDVLWAGVGLRGTGLPDFAGLVRAAYPRLPLMCTVAEDDTPGAAALLLEGAMDVVMDGQDEVFWQSAVRRALAEARALHSVREERGRILGAQTRLAAMGPAVDEILVGLAESVQDAVNRPDISLRAVESSAARAMSHFLGGALVVTMAYEKDGVLRPRAASTESPEHTHAAEYGFLLSEDASGWKEDLAAVTTNDNLTELVRETYAHTHCHLSMMGPPTEPFGVAAFLSNAAHDWMPEEKDLLNQLASHVGYCLKVARHFRVVLRRMALQQTGR